MKLHEALSPLARSRRLHRSALAALSACLVVAFPHAQLGAQVFGLQEYGVVRTGEVPEDIAVADFNGDGRLDLAVANTNAGEPAGIAEETVSVTINGAGGFAPAADYPVGDRPEGIVAADFDGDGITDLATANFQGESVSVLLGNEDASRPGFGDGTFTPAAPISVAGGPRGVAAGDWNGDSFVDLATANYNGDAVSILIGDGTGGFSVAKTSAVGNGPEVIAAGDVDSDGVADLVTCNALGDEIAVLRGTGTPVLFEAPQKIAVGDNPRHVRLVDLDADGYDEIVVANHLSSTVSVLKTADGAAFSLHATLSATGMSGPIYTQAGDVDGDGFVDLAVTYAKSDRLAVFPGGVGTTFGAPDITPAGRNALGIGLGDFDQNGLLDIAVSNALDDNLYIFFQTVAPAATIVDNGEDGTTSAGSWSTSGAPNPYGSGSLYAKATAGTTYTWARGLAAGSYAVLGWWTQLSTRNPAAPYAVTHAAGTTTVLVDQRSGGGRWQPLGTYYLDGAGQVRLSANTSTASTCADAVCFLKLRTTSRPPVAAIESISPSPAVAGDPVTFTAGGSDADGSVEGYEWTSSLNGAIGSARTFQTSSLSTGTHVVSLRVQDDDGFWSEVVQATLEVQEAPPPGGGLTYIIDNGDPGTASTGTWSVSGGPDPYGTESLYAKSGPAYTYGFSLATAGTYDVYAWWTEYSSRSSAVPYDIEHAGGTTTVLVNQRSDGGRWNYLGTFSFGNAAAVTIRAIGTASTCADAVALDLVESGSNQPPTAQIDSIAPSPADEGETVSFAGSGSDADGSVVAYEWTSSLDGTLSALATFSTPSLSPGSHTIGFRVRDDEGIWSDVVERSLEVRGATGMRVLDNGETGTSYTGVWGISGGSDPYGATSLWAKSGPSYTYSFPLATPGRYDVYAWWTEWSSRSNAVPYDIRHAGGITTVLVDQRSDGGMWNYLGTFDFGGSATVTIRAVGTASTCADAIAIDPAGSGNVPPTARIDAISPSPAGAGESVSFAGTGTDVDGSVTAHEWASSLDGVLSADASFSTSALTIGTHTISFRVQDDGGAWSTPATTVLEVKSSVELILDNGDPGTSSEGTWSVSGATDHYGPNSLYAKNTGSYRYAFTGLSPGTYRVSAWWTNWSSRSTAVPISIQHAGGEAVAYVDQQLDGGRWNLLGEFSFETQAIVTVHVVGSTSTCADAVKLEKVN